MATAWTDRANVERALQTLAGIAQGMAIDYEITDGEVGALTEWLSLYSHLTHRPPFKDLADLVERIVADGVIDEEEREELLDWCQTFASDKSVAVTTTTDALRRLHGVLHGIAADGEVTEQEAVDLGDWLQEYDDVCHVWPFCDLKDLLARVLADRKVDEGERAELLAFADSFVERAAIGGEHRAAVGHTITTVCNHGAEITFTGKTFLFTGKAARQRKDLHADVAARGGVPLDRVRNDLDYLVIGSLSQPAWAFANYGRKIEEVLALQAQGFKVAIVHEHALQHALDGH